VKPEKQAEVMALWRARKANLDRIQRNLEKQKLRKEERDLDREENEDDYEEEMDGAFIL